MELSPTRQITDSQITDRARVLDQLTDSVNSPTGMAPGKVALLYAWSVSFSVGELSKRVELYSCQ
jgi:hypothetical protein